MVSLDHALRTFRLYNEAREALHEKMMSFDREYGSIVKTVETALESMGEDWSTRVLQTSNYKRARERVSEALARDPELSRYFGGNGRGEKETLRVYARPVLDDPSPPVNPEARQLRRR